MNQPPNMPPGYGPPPGYGQPHPSGPHPQPSGPMPHSGSYGSPPGPPHGMRGMTRQMFNPASYRQPGSGSWAAASLILAIIGWITFGCLGFITWPLGLLFGGIGMVGNKRSKGLAFAGFTLSAIGVLIGFLIIAPLWYAFLQSEKMATEAGAPVVAAIKEFKDDNGRVPHNLDELVAMGYLPRTWNHGMESLSGSVRGIVEGREWSDFLIYRPGGDPAWDGSDGWTQRIERTGEAFDDFLASLTEGEREERTYQTYGLAYTAGDSWLGGTAVPQDATFDLAKVWGGDAQLREIMRTRRELMKVMRGLESRKSQYDNAIERTRKNLAENEKQLREYINRNDLRTPEAVRADAGASEYLALVGETIHTINVLEERKRMAANQQSRLNVRMRRLANQEVLMQVAESAQEAAELITLLEESRNVLDEKTDLASLATPDKGKAAEDWLRQQFGR